jgi:hypothetical protein
MSWGCGIRPPKRKTPSPLVDKRGNNFPASDRNIFVRSSTNSADARLRRGDSSALLHRRNHHHAIGEIERLLAPPEKRLIIPPHAAAPPTTAAN